MYLSLAYSMLNLVAHENLLEFQFGARWDFKLARWDVFVAHNSNDGRRNLAAVRAFVENWFYRILASHEKYYIPLR